MRFLIMGPPGAGKGTQAKILSDQYNLVHLSTGDILRNEIDNQTTIGLDAKNYMDQGLLVPDEVLLSMMENTLTNLKGSGIILDGFPRTIPQAEGLDAIFKKLDLTIDMVINIYVDKEILINRLIKRAEDSGRSDDTKEVIVNRQNVYLELTAPLLEFYKNEVINVDGDGTIEEVTQRVLAAIK
jgi:Adenylate kinase and related kinases|tara:strand:- start:490 stop:1041 length:552 start_codon:yes stop_codon:yes gene_type:complete